MSQQMDDQKPFRPPDQVQTGNPSRDALSAVRMTRRVLWGLMAIAVLSLPYSIVSCIGALWAAKFFDDSAGYYTGNAILGLTSIPVACVLLWQFLSLDRTLRVTLSEWRIESLLLALKRFIMIVSVAFIAYWIVLSIGRQMLIHLTVG